MDDDAGPSSLFALVYYCNLHIPYYSILQLHHEYTPEEMIKTKVVEKVRFNIPPRRYPQNRLEPWSLSPVESSTEDLYMVPNWRFSRFDTVKPVHGYKFSFINGDLLPIKLPEHFKLYGHLVNVSGHIYYFSHDWYYGGQRFCQCFDPVEKSWTDLKPFPGPFENGVILATAVWNDDTILLNTVYRSTKYTLWAYDVKVKEWCRVDVEDTQCVRIVGHAVVLGNTIYALTEDSVLALSIKKEEKLDGPPVFKCSLLSSHPLHPILEWEDRIWRRSRYLVHLGKDEFCVVQTCNNTVEYDCQPIQVTHITIDRDYSVIVMDEYFHQVGIIQDPLSHDRLSHDENMEFLIVHCFSLPKGATTALTEFKSFHLDSFEPIPGQEAEEENVKPDNDSLETDFTDEQGLNARKLPVNTTVYVRNLPPRATIRQLEKGLTKFGPIKSGGIQVLTSKRLQGKRVAHVEFESYPSLQCAITASTIRIGDFQAEITERGLTELNPDDCNNRTPSTVSSTVTSTPFLTERMGLLIADKQRDWLDNQRITLNRIMAGMVELAEKKGIVLETDLKPETTPYLYLSEIEDKLAAIGEQDALDADEGDDGSDAVP